MSEFEKARYIMMGGFLGAGKTTVVLKLAQHLSERGLKVGLITNDQGAGLVDTAMLRSRGFPVEEIAGGCFCCRFHSLKEAADKLTGDARPDVFIAEAVGSCTDLVATVSYPLRRIYGDEFTVSPLSVVIDPLRALRVFGVESGRKFSERVLYIYRKQLEEARIILMNKSDLLNELQRDTLHRVLEEHFPQADRIVCSARNGTGLDEWFDRLLIEEHDPKGMMEVDYDLYAEGEALLGWLNCTAKLTTTSPIEGEALMEDICERIRAQMESLDLEIAHLKMTLEPEDVGSEIAVLNLVGTGYVPEASLTLSETVEQGEFVLNLRAEADPETLGKIVKDAMKQAGPESATLTLDHLECFSPGKPEPVYRECGCNGKK